MSAIDLLEIIRREGSKNITPSFFIAEITQDTPTMQLRFNTMDIYEEQIMYTAWAKFLITGVNTSVNGEHAHFHHVDFGGIKKGDKVIIKKLNDRDVLIVDKVVI